jgi:tetrahydromethanopterin S-methyltransferase subunit D
MNPSDTAQILSALGIPTGPGIPLPAGAGNTSMAPAASMADPARANQIQQLIAGALGSPLPEAAQLGKTNRVPRGGFPS